MVGDSPVHGRLQFLLLRGKQSDVLFELFKFPLLLVAQFPRSGSRSGCRRRAGGLDRPSRAFLLLRLCLEGGFIFLDVLPVLAVAADKILDDTVAAENEEMVHEPVQEMTVMRNYDESAVEFLQVLLQDVQGHDVQVVGRLIQDQQIRLAHQDGQQVEPPLFPAGKLADAVVQHVMRK